MFLDPKRKVLVTGSVPTEYLPQRSFDPPKDVELFGPCLQTNRTVKNAEKNKMKAWATPAKSKASFASCWPEKLRATVRATRLENQQLEERLRQIESQIY